jgi:hypothetical protein
MQNNLTGGEFIKFESLSDLRNYLDKTEWD